MEVTTCFVAQKAIHLHDRVKETQPCCLSICTVSKTYRNIFSVNVGINLQSEVVKPNEFEQKSLNLRSEKSVFNSNTIFARKTLLEQRRLNLQKFKSLRKGINWILLMLISFNGKIKVLTK